jgi:hypothetical protein
MEQILSEILKSRASIGDYASLLRKHMGLNLYRGFESLRLRQASNKKAPFWALFFTPI